MAQIDLHSHAITQGYLEYIKANGAEMDEGFPIPSWDAERHIAFMDKAGIQTSVLTMPAPQPFFGNAEASAAVCRRYNEECAALKVRYPGRFLFWPHCPCPMCLTLLRRHAMPLRCWEPMASSWPQTAMGNTSVTLPSTH